MHRDWPSAWCRGPDRLAGARPCPRRVGQEHHPALPPLRSCGIGHLVLAVITLLAVLLPVLAAAQAPAQGAPPTRHRIGLYVTDLYGLDLVHGTFGATFWVWSVGPDSQQTLRTMEFANADQTTVSLESTVPRGPISWSQRKVTGTFRQNWDLRNFPFDRHSLEIQLEEGVQEEGSFAYQADTTNSGHGLRAPVAGWRVTGMRVEVVTAIYATNFGDPAVARPESRFARLRAVLTLERADYTGFLKLTAALYAGFLVCAIGCLMHVTEATFATRIALLVASLFALVVNMRTASVALGSEHGATLIDRLHMAGLAYVVAVTAVTVLVRTRLEGTGHNPLELARLDRRGCLGMAVLFVLANAWLLLRAAVEG